MKNLSKFEEFYKECKNPLDENLELVVAKFLTAKDKDSYYEKMTGDNYKRFKCGLTDAEEKYLLKEDGKWLYYFNGDKFYPNYSIYKEDVRHQLYISAGYEMLDNVKKEFIEFCIKNEIPFCLKVCNDKRDDNLVLYATDSNIFDYFDALRNYGNSLSNNNLFIQRSNILKTQYTPDVTGLLEPPILTSKVCSWIGYGSGNLDSFIENRVNYLEQVMPEVLNGYSVHNLDEYYNLKEGKKELLTDLRKYIIKTSEQANIDADNFAFNLDVASEIKGKKLVK